MEIQSDLSHTCAGICFTWQKHKELFRSRGCWEHQQGQQQREWLRNRPERELEPQQLLKFSSRHVPLSKRLLLFPVPQKDTGQLMFVECSSPSG